MPATAPQGMMMIAEHTTSALAAVFDEHPRHERGCGLRTLSLRSPRHPVTASTSMAQLACTSPLRFCNPRPRPVVRGLVHDHQEALPVCRSLATYRSRDRVPPTIHYRYATSTITLEISPSCPMTSFITSSGTSLRTMNTQLTCRARGARSTFCAAPQTSIPTSRDPAYSANCD